jgi:hypothetical protein
MCITVLGKKTNKEYIDIRIRIKNRTFNLGLVSFLKIIVKICII